MVPFIKKISTDWNLDFVDFVKTGDDNFIIIGNRGDDAFLAKIDPDGTIIWGKKIASPDNKVLRFGNIKPVIHEAVDFVIQGITGNSSGNNKYNPFFLKISLDGEIIWSKILKKEINLTATDLLSTAHSSTGPFFYFTYPDYQNVILGAIDTSGELMILKSINTQKAIFAPKLEHTDQLCLFSQNHFINLLGSIPQSITITSSFSLTTDEPGSIVNFSKLLIYSTKILFLGYDSVEKRHCLLSFDDSNLLNSGNFTEIDANFYDTGSDNDLFQGIFRHVMPNDDAFYFFYTRLHYPSFHDHRSFLMKFSHNDDYSINFTPIWRKTFNITHYVHKIIISNNKPEKLFIGTTIDQLRSGLFGKTGNDYESCVTELAPPINSYGSKLFKEPLEVSMIDLELPELVPYSFLIEDLQYETSKICPKPVIIPEPEHLLQSPYLHLQAAGSTGQDSTAGIHLRWMLLRNLGDLHLPKGELAENAVNFNKPEDFVHLYRAPYSPVKRTLNPADPVA